MVGNVTVLHATAVVEQLGTVIPGCNSVSSVIVYFIIGQADLSTLNISLTTAVLVALPAVAVFGYVMWSSSWPEWEIETD